MKLTINAELETNVKTAKTLQKFGFIKRSTYKGLPTKKAKNIHKALQGFALSFAK